MGRQTWRARLEWAALRLTGRGFARGDLAAAVIEHELKGLFRPRLRPFVIPLSAAVYGHTPQLYQPRGSFDLSRIAISNQTLYVINAESQLWTAPAPHPPRRCD